jgi:hypothetical protein
MRYLVYCIFKSPEQPITEMVTGIAGHPVTLISKNGLCAAVSVIADSDPVASISGLLAYEKTVESIQRSRTIIPMRYGCLFEEEAQLHHFIEERSRTYEALLIELEGCVEMGIRVLLEDVREKVPPTPLFAGNASLSIPTTPGAAYLEAQRARFESRDQESAEQQMIAKEICSALSGCFVRSKQEFSQGFGRRLLSLYFLIRGNAVESFREVFRSIRLPESARLLVSGPWPPYNFVSESNLSAALAGNA